jgi:hypothetical protein
LLVFEGTTISLTTQRGMKVRERGCILPMAGSVAEVAAILAL